MTGFNHTDEQLPDNLQSIIVFEPGLDKEIRRVFYLEFWNDYKRIL